MNEATRRTLHSSASNEWRTPPDLFTALHRRWNYDLDAAATDANALLPNYLTQKQDALSHTWMGRVFLNPPYGRGIGAWVRKARTEVERGRAELVTLLIPARTDTAFWHDDVMQPSTLVWLFRGRISFLDGDGVAQAPAPFPSALVVMGAGYEQYVRFNHRSGRFDLPPPLSFYSVSVKDFIATWSTEEKEEEPAA